MTIGGHRGDEIEAYIARPLGDGPFPGVVVIHHMPGWDPPTREIARKFAANGYLAITHHLYTREGKGTTNFQDAAAAARADGGVSDEQFLGDTAGAVAYVRALATSSGKVGVIGYCSGGRQSYIAACNLDVDAAVDCYGGMVVATPDQLTEKRPVAPVDMTPEMRCPILCLFGEEDANPSPEHRTIIEAALTAAGKTFEIESYPNAGHAFFAVDRPSYRVEAANAGWQKIFDFYGRHLGTE
ncbi:MAG TPA: dienelactone hydrolase family protein [Acidimicrobiales bacterium]|nr:dienelactone hydrolase family protein [Acidimicrobiales bacterium]